MPANDCQQLYSNLVTAVIRVGQADDALSLMKERKYVDGPGFRDGSKLLGDAEILLLVSWYLPGYQGFNNT